MKFVEKSTDVRILKQVSENDSDPLIRKAATERHEMLKSAWGISTIVVTLINELTCGMSDLFIAIGELVLKISKSNVLILSAP